MKITKELYKVKSINKINRWMGIIGLAMILWAVYFLFTKGYNQMFLLGTAGLTLLSENAYLIYKERKCGPVSMYSFIRISDGALSVLVFAISVYMFYMKETGSAIFCAIISFILALVVFFTRNTTEESFLELYEKHIDK